MFCVSPIFQTVENQFSVTFLGAIFSELQVNTIQPLISLPKKNILLALTLLFCYLLEKQNLLLEKLHQKDYCVVILYRLFISHK